MALISYAAFFLLLVLVPSFRAESGLYTICSVAVILNVIGVNWVYQALEEYSYITFISVLFKALGLGLMFLLVRNSGDVLWYGLVTVVSSFGSAVFNFYDFGNSLICILAGLGISDGISIQSLLSSLCQWLQLFIPTWIRLCWVL